MPNTKKNVQLQKMVGENIIDIMPITSGENVSINNDKLNRLVPSEASNSNKLATISDVNSYVDEALTSRVVSLENNKINWLHCVHSGNGHIVFRPTFTITDSWTVVAEDNYHSFGYFGDNKNGTYNFCTTVPDAETSYILNYEVEACVSESNLSLWKTTLGYNDLQLNDLIVSEELNLMPIANGNVVSVLNTKVLELEHFNKQLLSLSFIKTTRGVNNKNYIWYKPNMPLTNNIDACAYESYTSTFGFLSYVKNANTIDMYSMFTAGTDSAAYIYHGKVVTESDLANFPNESSLAIGDVLFVENELETYPIQFVEEGKGLSTNDYTTAEKNKLASLSNYTLPTASTSTLGGVKVDGTSIAINDGVISAIGGGGGDVPVATSENAGIVKPDNTSIVIDENGVISANISSEPSSVNKALDESEFNDEYKASMEQNDLVSVIVEEY